MGRTLHILLLNNTRSGIRGADRDWVTLANALGPDQVRVSWAGVQGCEFMRPYLDARVVARLVDLKFPPFTYLIQENAYRQRSAWLWTKILLDHLSHLARPLLQLHQALRDDPVDLVVSNTAVVTVGALFAWLHRKPHVWCIKECLDPNLPACRRLAWWIARMSSVVVVPSQAVAKTFPSPVCIFPDGSDVEKIQESGARRPRAEVLQSLNLSPQRPVVAQVGGIYWWKGQHVTAEAFVRLATSRREPPCSLLFLGRGGQRYQEKLERVLAHAPRQWQDAVRFVQFDPDDFSYLASADIVVHPSVLPDPFPNAVREAMILGKPVIASRDGGIPEMIQDDETGVLLEPGNPDKLAVTLHRLLSSPEQLSRLGKAAQRFASAYFDIHLRKQAFSQLFRSLTNGKSRILKRA